MGKRLVILYYKRERMKEKKQLEKVENYLLKNRAYALDGLTRAELQKELLLDDEEMEKLVKRKKTFTIGEAATLLLKIEKENKKKEV